MSISINYPSDLSDAEWACLWLSRNRRMSKDYERKVQASETLIELAMIRLLVARRGRERRRVLPLSSGSG